MAMGPVRLAVVGAGSIGSRHIDHVLAEPCSELVAIVDPSPDAEKLAVLKQTAWYPDIAAMLRHDPPEGIIVATPNQMHAANGLQSVAAGVPCLIEKPIADDVAEATRLVAAAEAAGVALLVGHHRRHNPLIQAAKLAIDTRRLGQVVAIHGTCWFYKPNDYFDAAWRREKGAGPVFLNLIHDVDVLRYLCGDVASVQALESNALRRHAVEETAVILLRFRNGVLGTVTVSDMIVAPWSWELTTGENPAYPHTSETCYLIGGTRGSLTIPYLDLWRNNAAPGWMEPIERQRLAVEAEDPLALQVRNFCDVIRGVAQPVVSGREGLATLKVIAAVKQAAATGGTVDVV
jgi:predicted dehydrogenase